MNRRNSAFTFGKYVSNWHNCQYSSSTSYLIFKDHIRATLYLVAKMPTSTVRVGPHPSCTLSSSFVLMCILQSSEDSDCSVSTTHMGGLSSVPVSWPGPIWAVVGILKQTNKWQLISSFCLSLFLSFLSFLSPSLFSLPLVLYSPPLLPPPSPFASPKRKKKTPPH